MANSLTAVLCVCLAASLEIRAVEDGYMEVGQYCKVTAECHFSATCESNTCKCKENYVQNNRVNKCLGGTGQTCRYDDDCIPFAYCQQQVKCACMDGLTVSADGMNCEGTVRSQIVDAKCNTNEACTQYGPEATCDLKLGECVCGTSQHFVDGKCYTVGGLGHKCSSTNECYTKEHPNRIVCSDSSHTCECKAGYVPSADKSFCDVGAAVQVTSLVLLLSMLLCSKVISS